LHSVRDFGSTVKALDVPDEPVDWRAKGFWLPTGTFDPSGRPGLFDGGFTWPVMVLRRAAAEANIATMAAYCARHGLDFAPHAKTTMAPGLIAAQLDAGAWGLTVATANQALVLRRLGVPRVFIANQVLDPTVLRWLAAENARGGAEVYFQVDSLAGVAAAGSALEGTNGMLRVFVELGHPGGRTGCRTVADLEIVARAAAAVDRLALVGVTAYEGTLSDEASVDAFLEQVADASKTLSELLATPALVSAGGSAWFDRVVAKLRPDELGRVILRSGASVTHDDGYYGEKTPFHRIPQEGPLVAALEVWAQVTSMPEPDLAVIGMGKRDAPFDEGLPVVLDVRRDDVIEPITGLTVTKLMDQHAYVSVAVDVDLRVGDLLRFGISHPCTAFDKWRHIPVVDEDSRVVDVLHTYF
jgi:D-serine deaminase-like pyridoxal phosphate-dependent protein